MKFWIYIALLIALLLLGLNLLITRILLALNNILLVVAVIAAIGAYVYDKRSGKGKR